MSQRPRFLRVIPNLLNAAEIQTLIDSARKRGFQPASVQTESGPQDMPMVRNNERTEWTDRVLACDIWKRIQASVPVFGDAFPIGLNDQWKIYRYEEGQRFNAHRDGVVRQSASVSSKLTLLVALQEADQGGGTSFYHDRVGSQKRGTLANEVFLTRGDALLFDHNWWHSGDRVLAGTKLILRSDVMFDTSLMS